MPGPAITRGRRWRSRKPTVCARTCARSAVFCSAFTSTPETSSRRCAMRRRRWRRRGRATIPEAAGIIDTVQDLVQQRRMGPRWHAAAQRGRALIALARGDWAAAVEHLDDAKAQDERAGIARNLPKIHRLLAEAYLGLEDLTTARTQALAVKGLA